MKHHKPMSRICLSLVISTLLLIVPNNDAAGRVSDEVTDIPFQVAADQYVETAVQLDRKKYKGRGKGKLGAHQRPEVTSEAVESAAMRSTTMAPTGDEEIPFVGAPATPQSHVFSGAATCTIPIRVPSGRAGISPNIELSYSSFQNSGWIGVGWSLDMGAIQRSTKRGTHYDRDDYVAAIGGSSIELINRGSYYTAKIESQFSRYYFHESQNYWEVIARDGTKYIYGNETEPGDVFRQENQDETFKWLLNRVEDTNGNYMTMTYVENQGEIYLEEIRYTGNDRANPPDPKNVVRFYIEDRPDDASSFTPNWKVVTAKRLKTIYIEANAEPARAYGFVYEQSDVTNQSILSSVLEHGGSGLTVNTNGDVSGGSTRPPIHVQYTPETDVFWQETAEGWGNIEFSIPTNPQVYGYPDLNGDGRADFVYRRDGSKELRAMISTGTDFKDDESWGYYQEHPSKHNHTFSDFNGDGRADYGYLRSSIRQGTLRVMLSNGNGFEPETVWGTLTDRVWAKDEEIHWAYADFNGDGKTDFGYRKANEAWVEWDWWRYLVITDSWEWYVMVANEAGDGFEDPVLWGEFAEPYAYNPRYGIADFNGDGKADLMYRKDNTRKMQVLLSQPYQDGFESDVEWGECEYYYDGDLPRYTFADFNGDGKTDYAYRRDTTNEWRVLLSKGDGSEELSWGSYNHDVYDLSDRTTKPTFVFRDFNGDGKTDFMYRWNDAPTEWWVLFSNGEGFEAETRWGAMSEPINEDRPNYAFADFTGDGKADFLYREDGLTLWRVMESNKAPFVLVSRMDNQMGGWTELEYEPSSSYTNTTLPIVLPTVSRITVDDGVVEEPDNTMITEFSYGDGLFDFNDREFRGFGYTKQINPDLTTIETQFHQESAYLAGRPFRIEVREPWNGDIPGALISETNQTWETYPLNPSGGEAAFVRLTGARRKTHDGVPPDVVTVETQEDYTYYDETHGSLKTRTVSGPGAETLTMTCTYREETNWVRVSQEVLKGVGPAVVRQTDYGYDSRGNLTSETFYNDSGPDPVVTRAYYSNGNLKYIQDANGNRTYYKYDRRTSRRPDGTDTYVVKIINALGHVVKKEWEYRFGKEDWVKDANQNKKDFAYDDFGRLVEVLFPDGGKKTLEYDDSVFPRHMVTKVKENGSGTTVDKYDYFDGLGRLIQSVTSGDETGRSLDHPACRSIVTWRLYDVMGRNFRVEGPVHSTGVGIKAIPAAQHPYRETAFDFRGRPDLILSPHDDGTPVATDYEYEGLTTTVTDADGKKQRKTGDYLGRTVRTIEDPDGRHVTTAFEYNAAGDVLTVTVRNAQQQQLSTTEMAYDTLGRKTQMEDPDMGKWSYEYDRNGNLIEQTDWDGETIALTITIDYDELNRVLEKTYTIGDPDVAPTEDVSFTYDKKPDGSPVPNGKGRLCSVHTPSVTTTCEAYDWMGRRLRVKKSIDGTPYETQYEYDLSGKLSKIDYPGGDYVVSYEYYGGTGLLMKVTGKQGSNPGLHLATFTDYPATGKARDVVYGNGVHTEHLYYDSSARLQSIFTYGAEAFQYRNYEYTAVGNISYFVDAGDPHVTHDDVSYEYEYDGLHRLVKERMNDVDHIAYAYDDRGNITSKEVVGAFTLAYGYNDSDHVHAVSSIHLNGEPQAFTFSYDDNGNMLGGYDFTDPGAVVERTITWNADNMPHSVRQGGVDTTFVYDGGGMRAMKSVDGINTHYIGDHYEVTGTSATRYVLAGHTRIAMIEDGGAITYFHKDHLGSSTVLTRENGSKRESAEYFPFGGFREHTGEEASDHKFTGQEIDPSTGLYNYGARLYDPIIGRFISPDTIVQNPYDPQMLNRYTYCRNNPLIYVDPDGHLFAEAAAVGAWMGAYFAVKNDAPVWKGALIGAATSLVTGGAFDVAGGLCAEIAMKKVVEGVALKAAQVGIHAAAGAVSGGINSTLTGGDVGLGMLTGAMSGGFGKYAGGLLPKGDTAQIVGRMAIGGALGGATAEIYGGSFETGFAWGAFTAFMGYRFNDEQEVHELYELAKRVWTGGDMIDALRETYGENNPHDNPYVNARRPYSERTPVDPETVKVQLEGLCYCMAGGLYVASGYVYANPELIYFGVGLTMDGSYRIVTGKELLGPVPNP